MRAATTRMMLAGAALLIAGCRDNQADQNIAITNEIPANADIEALPPDESSTTPSAELENGDANATFTDANVANNGY